MSDDFRTISVYTRSQAIADGVLVDVTETAKEAGFRVPTALTSAAWEACVSVPRGTEGTQDVRGRLWDVLCMCRYGIRGQNRAESEVRFALSVVTPKGSELVVLKAVMGPDDDGGPCLTIMLPEED